MKEDAFVRTSFAFNADTSALEIRVFAKRSVTLIEVQGDRSVIEAFGATKPEGYSVRQFGENVETPDEMKDDVAFMNKSQFRWGCKVPVAAGAEHIIHMPAVGGPGREKGVLALAYEYPKLFGLLQRKGAVYVSLSSE